MTVKIDCAGVELDFVVGETDCAGVKLGFDLWETADCGEGEFDFETAGTVCEQGKSDFVLPKYDY